MEELIGFQKSSHCNILKFNRAKDYKLYHNFNFNDNWGYYTNKVYAVTHINGDFILTFREKDKDLKPIDGFKMKYRPYVNGDRRKTLNVPHELLDYIAATHYYNIYCVDENTIIMNKTSRVKKTRLKKDNNNKKDKVYDNFRMYTRIYNIKVVKHNKEVGTKGFLTMWYKNTFVGYSYYSVECIKDDIIVTYHNDENKKQKYCNEYTSRVNIPTTVFDKVSVDFDYKPYIVDNSLILNRIVNKKDKVLLFDVNTLKVTEKTTPHNPVQVYISDRPKRIIERDNIWGINISNKFNNIYKDRYYTVENVNADLIFHFHNENNSNNENKEVLFSNKYKSGCLFLLLPNKIIEYLNKTDEYINKHLYNYFVIDENTIVLKWKVNYKSKDKYELDDIKYNNSITRQYNKRLEFNSLNKDDIIIYSPDNNLLKLQYKFKVLEIYKNHIVAISLRNKYDRVSFTFNDYIANNIKKNPTN